MHTVDRGPEPPGLRSVSRTYTPRWVRHYPHGHGTKPSDSKWQDFQPDLSGAFFGLCGYCEEICPGEVDHFRPKSKFPELVYKWNNWVLACNVCNRKKGKTWPTVGYVDPCVTSRAARAESYFDFDTKTGEILPKSKLASRLKRRADRMIEDLGLNADHHRKARAVWLRFVLEALHAVRNVNSEKLLSLAASREMPLSSLTRAWLQEHGYAYGD